MRGTKGDGLARREFLRTGAAAIGVCALGAACGDRADDAPVKTAAEPPRIRRHRSLGRTGLSVPDLSFGTGVTADANLMRYAIDRGVTYLDTAEGYPLGKPGLAETAIGEATKGRRNQVVIATKTIAEVSDTRAVLMKRLEDSLRRLDTDYIDVYFNHAVNDVARVRNPEWLEFTEEVKRQGKIRYRGMSGHGGNLIECLGVALDDRSVDVVLTAYNFGQDPAFYENLTKNFDLIANQEGLPKVLARAHQEGVGVLVMKTLMGARLNDMRPYEWQDATFAQAAFRWVLANDDVDGIVISMNSQALINEYLGASGQSGVRPKDVALLERYLAANGTTSCRLGCNACESSCPSNVRVSDVLRARMYAVDYGAIEAGRATYAELGDGASACLTCAVPTCVQACPHGVDVPRLTRSVPALLQRA